MSLKVATPLTLPNGKVARNRFSKAATSEALADPSTNLPTARLDKIYKIWADGGLGISVTGNVQVDRRYLENPRNVVLDSKNATDGTIHHFKRWATNCKSSGTLAIMQISHAGRQCPVSCCSQPIAPSAVGLRMPGIPQFLQNMLTVPPRAMTNEEIKEAITKFGDTASLAEEAGFDGVQIHGAHGYLISSFLSPNTNKRTDEYGGSLENRSRILFEVIAEVRSRVSKTFCVFLKLNSADFQRGGFTEGESHEIINKLQDKGLDAIEISGGTYEQMEAMTIKRDSTRQREAYFLEFAAKVASDSKIPLILTGGFSTITGVETALSEGIDVVGLVRPVCLDPEICNKLIEKKETKLPRFDPVIGVASLDKMFETALMNLYYQGKLQHLDDPTHTPSLWWILIWTINRQYYWDPLRNKATTAALLAGVGLSAAFFLGKVFGLSLTA
eukprot:TRINITY_DN180_c2_g1_i1.p1 TRINITY_DN180_c2_g1~~TRINITY_DN180_c2_g1_i1.p1  ORF type:complete len:444 (+),score=88.73 TRINITY_DN180_c2_g1_i1:62-1393(+)